MTFSQLLTVLKARKISAVIVLIITVGTTVGINILLPNQYTATASVVIDVKSPDPISGMVLAGMMTPAYMATQVDIITSDRVARRVVQGLRLTENQQLRDQWLEDAKGQGDFEAWVAQILQKKLEVKPSRESNVINISYKAPEPKFSAVLANTFVQAYIDTSLELRADPAKQYSTLFDARAKEMHAKLEQAQEKLSEYQKEHGIANADERFDYESQRLSELNSQLVALQAISAESTGRTAQARTQADQLQDAINNPVISSLRADISRQDAKLQELSASLGDAHPQVQQLKANIASLRERTELEIKRIGGSVGITNNINKSRELEIRTALEIQRAKVIKMKEQHDTVTFLTREIDSAQRIYDVAMQRQNMATLESQNNLTNISVLTPATEPSAPASPKVALNIILSIFIGGIFGTITALIREIFDRRIRTLEDVINSLDAPVIGVIPRPLRKKFNRSRVGFILPSNLLGHIPSSGK